ncbi:fructoselysine 6-kinase [Neobacillus sp. YIM B02564]|uniref:Fructoselysine 6-kinase n=1 Tax=Neobacillus paridis TaxID=2803862 RepID=A0ABS1TTF3_9BACI|nr:fructoselysine 6-kinase [Neobacillus paridis]MBL4954319.1 fructoselysine 6-kinase [Neobacillus paridis]
MKLVAIGDNCIDFYEQTNQAFSGGNAVNVAVYFHRNGGESAYIGAVGTDEFGQVLLNGLKAKGVDVSHVHVEEGTTAVTQVELVNGDRVFGDYNEGVMEHFKLREEDYEFIKNFDIVTSGFWGHVHQDFKYFHEQGIKTAFDFATKLDDPLVGEVIPYIDYAFFSYDGEDINWIKEFMKKLHHYDGQLIIVTRGDKGSIVYDGKDFHEFGIIPCEVVDTIGAGDSYIAGFLMASLKGLPIVERMKFGAETSAVTIGYNGAW